MEDECAFGCIIVCLCNIVNGVFYGVLFALSEKSIRSYSAAMIYVLCTIKRMFGYHF